MNKVETYSNWCEIDRLDGIDLVDGEFVHVLWPDGTETKGRVIVAKSSYEISDMGHPWTVPASKSYLKVKINGQYTQIALAGTNIKLERAKTRSKK